MHFLAISGSTRALSTNTALLRALAGVAAPDHHVTVFAGLADLPVFCPDLEGNEPAPVLALARQIAQADGLIISSPEYVHAIPGGLKNAIDWLVSRDELIGKPIALVHASHRGEDVLAQLRLVLATVSDRFTDDPFIAVPLIKRSPDEIADLMDRPENRARLQDYLSRFAALCAGDPSGAISTR
ncbi:MAG: NADPH-dependent FMN reductase [Tabrizicola sp.]